MKKSLIIGMVCLYVLAGCGRGKGSDAVTTIVTLKGPSSMGMIQFIDSVGRAAGAGTKVVIVSEPMQARKMMLDGTADFAVLPTTMAAMLYNKGLDYQLISVPVWGTLYLFGTDSTVTDWKSLKGKRVNVMARGMTPDALFRYLLRKNGLEPDKDVILDYSFPTHIDLANAVMAGRATLGVISEPYVSLSIEKNPSIRQIMDLNAEWGRVQGVPLAQTALLGRRSFVKDNAKFVSALEAAYARSTAWVNANPDSAAVLIVKYGILPDTATARASIPRSNLEYESARDIEKELKDYFKVFYDLNPDFVGGKLPDEKFYYKK